MVTWRRAFKGAVEIIAWSLVWVVIGTLLIIISIATVRTNVAMAFLLSIVGYVIAGLGIFTAFLKIIAEVTTEEVKRRMKEAKCEQ